jgi:hypothetical protein
MKDPCPDRKPNATPATSAIGGYPGWVKCLNSLINAPFFSTLLDAMEI